MEGGRWGISIAFGGLLICAGCPAPTAPPPAKLPLEGVTLKLLVVADPAIAKAVSQLRGEWKAVSGGELEVLEQPLADAITADVVIFPSRLLGELVEHGHLLPIPQATLESNELAWTEVFDLLKSREATWGQETYALPLGSPVFTLMYRADLLKKLGKEAPNTWPEYLELAETLKSQEGIATVEPLAPGWSGKVLLARAASYAKHPDNYSTLFHKDSMEPLIAGPPFVRALAELVAASKFSSAARSQDPKTARQEVLAGRAAMALTWATAADSLDDKQELPPGAQIAFAELPGSEQVYNIGNQNWEPQTSGKVRLVPLLSIAGRLASVTQASEKSTDALRLITWLSGPKWSSRVAAVSSATTLYRNSQLKSPQDWVDANLDANAAVEYGDTVQKALVRESSLSTPRIPGEVEYLQALDEAVTTAGEGAAKPEVALATAAAKWQEITNRFGLTKQRQAYHRSLGLEL